jgi:uncharacterized membrane protein YfcA
MAWGSIKPKLAPFYLWLMIFYGSWVALVVYGDYLQQVLAHWPMALAMVFGSFIAGSTPMGGGTVGFPVLVLLFDLPATLGRDFSFAIQAVGMTSASIYILCSGKELEWPMLRSAIVGAMIGTPLGVLYIAPLTSDLFIKLLFASMWCSFGLLHLRRITEITSYEGMTPHDKGFDHRVGFAVGVLGSLLVASVTGVGVDMMIYMVLVLWCHADLRIAIPTSVILMAFTSLLGIALKLSLGGVEAGTFENWLAAAPVVAIGAPLGALVVSKLNRRSTLVAVSLLCVAQFVWTLLHERDALSSLSLAAALVAIVLFLIGFQIMYRYGIRLARRSRA